MKKILDWNSYTQKAVEAAAEGIVMVKNDNNVLPLDISENIAVFGRMQLHYYKSGSGSGGMVNVYSVTGILEGLAEAGARIDRELLDIYKKWDSENPIKTDSGWGQGMWSQEEMPLDSKTAEGAALRAETAVVIIARTSGEELDMTDTEGSFRLTAAEKDMLKTVRSHFKKMIVLLNVGGIIDITPIEADSILFVWQGGMTGGTAVAKILFGCSPSGKLPDTIAYSAEDYPSYQDYSHSADSGKCVYTEDIYNGYRYFETFAKDRVIYPFGFGLSYTTFELTLKNFAADGEKAEITVNVKNTGKYDGKETVQIYLDLPCGKLGNPSRQLCGYKKTSLLAPDSSEDVTVTVDLNGFASYDDDGTSGNIFCYVLEEGCYEFYMGTDCRSCEKVGEIFLPDLKIVRKCRSATAPVEKFKRLVNSEGSKAYRDVHCLDYDESERRRQSLPRETEYTGDRGITLSNVKSGKASMNDFIAQLTDSDLAAAVRGEGMGSPKVTSGTAAAFGGVNEHMKALGVPCACCDDGPSGLRLDCGDKAFSLPIGTMLAASFNDELVSQLYSFTGLEMAAHNIEVLLGPGMNIHRHPLNGRNFEYFSEDPYLTGRMGTAILKGLKSGGVSGTVKHFCANNRENNRHGLTSVVSERALREIYLKGFEMAVKSGYCDSVMTTYGAVNGLWTAGSYDLCTETLRREWGFKGIVMTDWWADINRRGRHQNTTDFAAMAMAQNDIYMVCPHSEDNNDNILESLSEGELKRSELQRNAANIFDFVMYSRAMARLEGTADTVEIINLPEDSAQSASEPVYYDIVPEGKTVIPVEGIPTEKGTNYSFVFNVPEFSKYRITVTASSEAAKTAQIPVTVFVMGSPAATFTWSGTGGKPASFETEAVFLSGYTSVRLYFAQSGLKLEGLTFEKCE